MSEQALRKKKCLKLGIIISCILIPFLFSYAANNDKVSENGSVAVNKNNRQAVSTNPDSSKDVKQIQTLLALLKFNPGPIDGILGQKTTKAIRAFQLNIGVPVTGEIEGDLKSQLDKAYRQVVIRTKEQTGDDQEKPQIKKEKPQVTSESPATKRGKEVDTGKELDVKPKKEIETAPQKEPAAKDHNLKTENQYLKYIKISFPIIAIIFLAYFYRIWSRSHETKRDKKRPQKAEPEAERFGKAKPEEESEGLFEVSELEKEITENAAMENADGKAELDQQAPMDYHDPLHPASITPVVRRKVWIRNKGQCAACGSRKDLQYDYIVPISEGGNNTLDNLQLLCETCNQKKSDK